MFFHADGFSTSTFVFHCGAEALDAVPFTQDEGGLPGGDYGHVQSGHESIYRDYERFRGSGPQLVVNPGEVITTRRTTGCRLS